MDHINRQIERLQSPNKNTRYDACEELRVAPKLPPEAFAALELAANDPNLTIASAANRALLAHRPAEMYSIPIPSSLPESQQSQPAITQPVGEAGFWRRWLALTIDMIILGIAVGCLNTSIGILGPAQGWWAVAWGLLGLAIPAVYFIWSYSTSGQTLGKRALKIKVISIDGTPLNWRKGILRTAGYLISGFPFYLGYFWSIWDKDKQAWHDKLAGTRVLPVAVAGEPFQGYLDPEVARQRQRRWLLGLGIPAILILTMVVSGFIFFMQRGLAEVKEMGPWPRYETPPEVVVEADLSDLGLVAGKPNDVSEEGTWAEGEYKDGASIGYSSSGQNVVGVTALRYAEKQAANNEFHSLITSAKENCNYRMNVNGLNSGVIYCQFSNGHQKLFLNDYWIVVISAYEGTEYPPEVLVDRVRDALAAHWEDSSAP